jgi:hypothetical protein
MLRQARTDAVLVRFPRRPAAAAAAPPKKKIKKKI